MENLRSELDKPLVLKERTRKKLQRIYGELVSTPDLPGKLSGEIVICVGDVVTDTLLSLGIQPDVAIVDYKTKREKMVFERIKNYGDKVLKVRNPAGTITPELWATVRKAISMGEKVRVDVDGEEDLAVIPVIYFAPLGATVIYGMPNTGLVLIKVSDEDKKKVNEIIREMEV